MRTDIRFPAMGSSAHVVVHGDPRLLDVAARRLAVLEARWSRFRPASEISRLNADPGRPAVVSADTVRLLLAMREAHDLTGGTYQPGVLEAMASLGYDRTLLDVVPPETLPDARALPPFRAEIDERTALVRLSSQVDPGGIGKGLAADIVAGELMAAGAEVALVNVGGDLRVRGVPGGGDAWTIAIEHPDDPSRSVAVVQLRDGGVATSTVARRRWTAADGSPVHHLIDPRTTRPAAVHHRQVTVVSGTAQWAEVAAKCVLVDGAIPPAVGAAALCVDDDGRLTMAGEDASAFFAAAAITSMNPTTEVAR